MMASAQPIGRVDSGGGGARIDQRVPAAAILTLDGRQSQRQRVASVLQQDGALARAVAGELDGVGVADLVGADGGEGTGRGEVTQANAHAEEAAQHRVDIVHRDGAVAQRVACSGGREIVGVQGSDKRSSRA